MRLDGRLRTAGWLFLALLMSLGAGGIVAGGDHPAGDATRPELTARGDAAVAPGIERLAGELEELEAQVGELSRAGRDALVDLTARRLEDFRGELDRGGRVLAAIEDRIESLRARYEELPYGPDSDRISGASRERIRGIAEAIEGFEPLRGAWDRLSLGSLPAVELATLLEDHDQRVFAATRAGTDGRYAEAIRGVQDALDRLDLADATRRQLTATSDLSTLDAWLDRSRAYDRALLRLYRLLRRSGGEATDETQAALDAVDRAEAELPADNDALVVTMAEIAQGGLNEAVVAIERARGRLSEAIVAARGEERQPPE